MSTAHLSADRSPTAAAFHVYTDFANEIDLTDGSQGPADACARALQAMTLGVLAVRRLDGEVEEVTVPFPGWQLAGACSAIMSSGDGTTVTEVLVYW